VSVKGTQGRAELEVVERGFVLPAGAAGVVSRPAIDPSVTPDSPLAENVGNIRPAGQRLLVQRHWQAAFEVAIPAGDGAYGGGDSQLLDDVFGPGARPGPVAKAGGLRRRPARRCRRTGGERVHGNRAAVPIADHGLRIGV
jgi:hypothetical protein